MKRADDIILSGMGVVMPSGTGKTSARESWEQRRSCFSRLPDELVQGRPQWGGISIFSTSGIIPPLVNRRLDRATRLAWLSAKEAFEEACLDPAAMGERLGMVTGSVASGNEAAEAFMLPYLERGVEAASPMVFPNCVAVSISGNLSTGLKFKGPSTTLIGPENATLVGLGHAVRWLTLGMADAVLVVGTDGLHPLLLEVLWRTHLGSRHALPVVGSRGGFLPGEGAQAFVVERRATAEKRGARPLAAFQFSHVSRPVAKRAEALLAAMEALHLPSAPGVWIGGANGHRMLDEVEAQVVLAHSHWPTPHYPKCLWGELCGSGGQLLAAALLDGAPHALITAPSSSDSQVAMFVDKLG